MQRKNKRKDKLSGDTIKFQTGCGTLYITVNYDNNNPFEIFIRGSNLACEGGLEGLGRLVSALLQKYNDVELVIDQLQSIRCSPATVNNSITCTRAIAQALTVGRNQKNENETNKVIEPILTVVPT